MEPRFIRHDPPREYAKACVYGDLIFLAGEIARDEKSGKLIGTTTGEQAEKTFLNIKATLESLGSSLEHVVRMMVYLKDTRDRNVYGPVRSKYVPHGPPGALIMGVDLAEPEILVEIDVTATIPGGIG